jgi:hypothetical protein
MEVQKGDGRITFRWILERVWRSEVVGAQFLSIQLLGSAHMQNITYQQCVRIIWLNPWSRIRENLMINWLFKTFPAVYGTWRIIAMFTRACYQSTPSHHIKICFNIILPSTLIALSYPFPSGFQNKVLYLIFSKLSHIRYITCPSQTWRDFTNNISWSVQIIELLVIQFSLPSSHFSPNTPFTTLIPLTWEMKFHTHTKEVVLYILIFMFLDERLWIAW